jgi:quinol monooxygenase YgiN
MLVIAGTLIIDVARRDDAIAAATAMQIATLQEAGCNAYQFSIAVDDPSKVCIFEEWDDQESLDAHFATPHMATFQQQIAGIVLGRGSITKYQIASSGPLR